MPEKMCIKKEERKWKEREFNQNVQKDFIFIKHRFKNEYFTMFTCVYIDRRYISISGRLYSICQHIYWISNHAQISFVVMVLVSNGNSEPVSQARVKVK